MARPTERPGLVETLGSWVAFGLVGLALAVTYSRLPPETFYNVSEDGVDGGLGRALTYLNFPVALAALAFLAIVADRMAERRVDIVALLAAALCLVVGVPGVVDQGDLDGKAANAIPALGVALALGLSLYAVRRSGAGHLRPWMRGDPIRLVLAVLVFLAALPWILTDLGVYPNRVPGLGWLMGDEVIPEPGHPEIRAVHLGHHHGLDGALFALTALGLSRQAGRMRRPALRTATTAYLALMLVYGLANVLQDGWLEQLVKRGTTSIEIPSMLRPELSPAWLALLGATAGVYVLLVRTRSQGGRW